MFTLSTLIYLISYFILITIYFRIADKFNIIDKPNERSSHKGIVIRGAGIIFPIAFLITMIYTKSWQNWYLLNFGLLFISIISFLDDIMTLSNKIRISIHFIAVALLMLQLNAFQNFWYVIPFTFIITVGLINAYNFMDGINGITALYSLAALLTFYLIQNEFSNSLPIEIYFSMFAAISVFSFYNLRKKAKCFSGDVGSIAIAFILSYLILDLILHTGQLKWLLFMGIYGLDSVATIVLRLFRKENIFKAHRSHFYQYLANDLKINHVLISFAYALSQLLINYVVYTTNTPDAFMFYALVIILYVITRLRLEGYRRLFVSY
jgi:UDP-N-acetylmuramyl pentapeptide phosphotransferase/UDP-N-acetylglucosamine-1-phosphate transferase